MGKSKLIGFLKRVEDFKKIVWSIVKKRGFAQGLHARTIAIIFYHILFTKNGRNKNFFFNYTKFGYPCTI